MTQKATNEFHFVSAPRAKAGEVGRVACLPVSATAAVLDLTTLNGTAGPNFVSALTSTKPNLLAMGSIAHLYPRC